MNPSSIVEESKGLEHLKYGRCEECNEINTKVHWCQTCNSKRFQQNFNNWTIILINLFKTFNYQIINIKY